MKFVNVKNLLLLVILFVCFVFADASADVFGDIAGKAGKVAYGLQKSGQIIAGLGLIGFSVAALFNKISWKTLAYIMVSTFILTLMIDVIAWAEADPEKDNTLIEQGWKGYKPNASSETPSDATPPVAPANDAH
jgi:hypothetical protein